MPTVKFKMLPPTEEDVNHQPILFKCKTCGEVMMSDEIDGHAKRLHNATSVMVDTTINHSEYPKQK